MTYLALRFRLPVALEEDLSGFLLTLLDIQGIEENSGETSVHVSEEEWDDARRSALEGFLSTHTAVRFLGSEVMEQRDWNAEWEASITPERVTERLVITPSWHKEE